MNATMPPHERRLATQAARHVFEALRAAGWKVTTRAAHEGGGQAYYMTPEGRESTLLLTPHCFGARTWRWWVDGPQLRRRGRSEMVASSLPDGGRAVELSCATTELEAIAAWLPGWLLAREAGEPLPDLRVPWRPWRAGPRAPGTPFDGGYVWTDAGWALQSAYRGATGARPPLDVGATPTSTSTSPAPGAGPTSAPATA
jgi:hypothetical protein